MGSHGHHNNRFRTAGGNLSVASCARVLPFRARRRWPVFCALRAPRRPPESPPEVRRRPSCWRHTWANIVNICISRSVSLLEGVSRPGPDCYATCKWTKTKLQSMISLHFTRKKKLCAGRLFFAGNVSSSLTNSCLQKKKEKKK